MVWGESASGELGGKGQAFDEAPPPLRRQTPEWRREADLDKETIRPGYRMAAERPGRPHGDLDEEREASRMRSRLRSVTSTIRAIMRRNIRVDWHPYRFTVGVGQVCGDNTTATPR